MTPLISLGSERQQSPFCASKNKRKDGLTRADVKSHILKPWNKTSPQWFGLQHRPGSATATASLQQQDYPISDPLYAGRISSQDSFNKYGMYCSVCTSHC